MNKFGLFEPSLNLTFVEVDLGGGYCYTVYTEHRQKRLGDIIFDISTGWVYITEEDSVNTGYFTSPFLRAIADKLDELNAELFKGFPTGTSESVVTQC